MIEDRHRQLIYFSAKPCTHAGGHQSVKIKHSNGNTTGLKHVCKHSPTGMNWGYGGSGPADCALSILADFCKRAKLGVRIANENYQEFKWVFVADFADSFELTGEQIEKWLIKKKLIKAKSETKILPRPLVNPHASALQRDKQVRKQRAWDKEHNSVS